MNSSLVFYDSVVFSQRLLEEVQIIYLTSEGLLGFTRRVFLDSDGNSLHVLINIEYDGCPQNLRFDCCSEHCLRGCFPNNEAQLSFC